MCLKMPASPDYWPDGLSYTWTINDVAGPTGVNPSISWATLQSDYNFQPGITYNVALRVWDGADELLPEENLYFSERELVERLLHYINLSDEEKNRADGDQKHTEPYEQEPRISPAQE